MNTPRYGHVLFAETMGSIEKILDRNGMPNEHEGVHAIAIGFGGN
jgi:hypothetical protein